MFQICAQHFDVSSRYARWVVPDAQPSTHEDYRYMEILDTRMKAIAHTHLICRDGAENKTKNGIIDAREIMETLMKTIDQTHGCPLAFIAKRNQA